MSSGAATIIVLLILGAIALVASVVGFIATGALGMDWSLRTRVADAAVAVAIYAVCAIVFGMLQHEDGVRILSSAVAAVLGGGVLRHVGRRFFGSGSSARAP